MVGLLCVLARVDLVDNLIVNHRPRQQEGPRSLAKSAIWVLDEGRLSDQIGV